MKKNSIFEKIDTKTLVAVAIGMIIILRNLITLALIN